MGDDFDEIMDSIDISKDKKKSIKVKTISTDVESEKKVLKKRITVKTVTNDKQYNDKQNTDKQENIINATVSEDIKNKYKNRK